MAFLFVIQTLFLLLLELLLSHCAKSTSFPNPIVSPSNISLDIASLAATTCLSQVEIICFERSAGYNIPIHTEPCLEAVDGSVHYNARLYLLPRLWKKDATGEGLEVPVTWSFGGCNMIINTQKTSDREAFSLVTATYFASLVLQKCVRNRKEPLGGRFVIRRDGFYIDLVGGTPPQMPVIDRFTDRPAASTS